MKIEKIRPVLLSAPYALPLENAEVDLHLQSGFRTTGLVEITLSDGTTGLGEAYLAVFAPKVFVEIVSIITPYIIDREIIDIASMLDRISMVTGYWSLQGAAQHVLSAFDIALHDCKAKLMGIPVYKLYNINGSGSIQLYGSGGDSLKPEFMENEFDYLKSLGIGYFKIRARNNQINKVKYVLEKGQAYNIRVAIDMTQNLIRPGQTPEDVISFFRHISGFSDAELFFLEEVLGIDNGFRYPELRQNIPVRIAGGEIVTTPYELIQRIEHGWYDIVQPDATVIGGISALLEVFKNTVKYNAEIFAHCWGGPVSMAANYHAAVAAGGIMCEWPIPHYPLRGLMMTEPWNIENGVLRLAEIPGLGVKLTKEIEKEYKFREEAVYSCIPNQNQISDDEVWES